MRTYYVYIVTNSQRSVLYIGVTNNVKRRLAEHQSRSVSGFTDRYNCTYLVYIEDTTSVEAAIAREKQLKKWSRTKKERLISHLNPEWEDLSTSVEMTSK